MFYVNEWAWELIICLLNVLKTDFGEVDKPLFQVSKGHAFLDSRSPKKRLERFCLSYVLRGMDLRTHTLPSGRLKTRQLWSRWSDILSCRKAMGNHFLLPGHRKKRIWQCRLSYVLSRRMGLRTHNLSSGRLKTRFWRSRWSVLSRCREALRTHFVLLGYRKNDIDEFV
jgi:hypothetical protein